MVKMQIAGNIRSVPVSPGKTHSLGSSVAIACMVIVLLLAVTVPVQAADKRSSPPAGLSREEALRLGERMYRDGILPSGDQMQAVVEGDMSVEGSMFTCAHCHMRSGLGSVEGTIISPPTNGAKLYRPRKSGQELTEKQRKHLPAYFQTPDTRPAYTDKTLAEVLQSGIDPAGKKLDPIMPRYLLTGRDLDILVYYLKNLSSELSAGVTETTLRFATVVSEGVSKDDRDAMLLPLKAYIRDREAKAPYFKARTRSGLFPEEMDLSYRGLALATWVLKGPPETWSGQLSAYYQREPVFAILGGIVKGSWAPVHTFCEQNQIPCLFPVTDQPVISETDWYTQYLSKGPYREGEAAAKFIKDMNSPVVQVFRNTDEGRSISRGFRETRKQLGLPPADEIMLNPAEKITEFFLKDRLSRYEKDIILVVWLNNKDIVQLFRAVQQSHSSTVMASATVLGEGLYLL
ncbi:MAG TPA: hypothetical protein VEP69_02145, partial [Thermodesulfovibrionales bacterium]|nr:hypothetical protein [Thermodesulfovibrionales bacterium]